MITKDLFNDSNGDIQWIADGTALLHGFVIDTAIKLFEEIEHVAEAAPFRHMITPGGYKMSVAMTNCGPVGWTSDRNGYRYERADPTSGYTWPPLPEAFLDIAARAAVTAGYESFAPDVCLINRYTPGARLSLHQDNDEADVTAPIISVSLGLPATFLFGGARRADKAIRLSLHHGDVVIWGGPARLFFHGVAPLKDGVHPMAGPFRYNLTLRKAR